MIAQLSSKTFHKNNFITFKTIQIKNSFKVKMRINIPYAKTIYFLMNYQYI